MLKKSSNSVKVKFFDAHIPLDVLPYTKEELEEMKK